MDNSSIDVTVLLARIQGSDEQALSHLIELLYDQFRQRAQARLRHERAGHSFGPTDLAHEAVRRLLLNEELVKAKNRNQLYRAFARAMRQALIDHARRRKAGKRGGACAREELDDAVEYLSCQAGSDAGAVHEALSKLASRAENEDDDRSRRTESALEMKFFGGFTHEEIAAALGVSLSTIERDLRWGLAWLRTQLTADEPNDCR